MRILLASDGSENSLEAARFLTRLEFSPRDVIIIFHVLSTIPYDDDYHARIRLLIRKVAPRILSSTAEILKPLRAGIECLETEGYPDTSIIEAALENKADAIVMGARGVKGLKLLVLGSVTRSVAINSPKHTLIVKQKPRSSRQMNILLATDGSDCSESAADFLASLPFPLDTQITVLHVTQSALSDIPSRFILNSDLSETFPPPPLQHVEPGGIFNSSRRILEKRFSRIEGMFRTGSPSMEILKAASDLDAELIAVGSRGKRGLKGMLGSVSRNVLAYSRCSVLIGKSC